MNYAPYYDSRTDTWHVIQQDYTYWHNYATVDSETMATHLASLLQAEEMKETLEHQTLIRQLTQTTDRTASDG